MSATTHLNWIILSVCLLVALSGCTVERRIPPASTASELSWPAITKECRPWARWWWLGSAVDKINLTQLLTQYQEAGLGGVEICSIYGVRGYEERFIDFLSPKWMEMLAHTTTQAKRLGLGVDLTTGTGWPFGGPNVSAETASARVILKRYELASGDNLKSKLPDGELQFLLAISDSGQQINLTDKANEGYLDWTAPPGQWQLYTISKKSPIQKVKRAAPGGEGYVLDPYSVTALDKYLARFDKAFSNYRGDMPRSHFHDSFEYYSSSWTTDFFHEFESRRGYDLHTQIPALFGDGPEDTVKRVKGDYRETLSDLHLAYIQFWTQWCHEHGSISRNQAHGAPGNLLDIYAAADIPETEIFGGMIDTKIPPMKFSSSAAHVTGRKLASAESFTWFGEHFQVPLSEVKRAADFLFTTGVNHIFFHGIPYSPEEAPWPGWQFYASVNFSPSGGLWHDLPYFNAYVTRCQSVLQSGTPANDVLLYLPVHDIWHTSGELLMQFTAHNMDEKWIGSSSFFKTAMMLWKRGYAFDEVSDRLLAKARCRDDKILLGGNAYKVVIVPQCHLMPVATMQKLVQLARGGATIVFQESLPTDVPGLGDLEKRRAKFQKLLTTIKPTKGENPDIQRSAIGKGAFLTGKSLEKMLQDSGVPREPSVDMGIRFVRRAHSEGHHYFLVNWSESSVDGWVTLDVPVQSAVILDPRSEDRIGVAALRQGEDGLMQVYLQLQPGQSCILRTFDEKTIHGPAWCYFQHDGVPKSISGTWKIQFVEGGPESPAGFETQELASWTTLGNDEARRFAGTARYTIEFEHPAVDAYDWLLDLGRVCESARVKLNGRSVGGFWCQPFQIAVGKFLVPGKNKLEVEVTNLAANRIRDLDRRKVKWKYFYDINVVNRKYKPLDASDWPLRDSGLLGPVLLQPVKKVQPATGTTVKEGIPPPTNLPAFPGAEGAGALTPGGRGGKVIQVTNLNDSGPGSLREAVEADGPRIVVFRVSGIITLEKPLAIPNPFITIAGQTAPGDGICIRGQTTEINTHDVVLRYLRFRRGNLEDRNDALGGYPVRNIIVDHCSASWGLDENLSLYRYMRKMPGGSDKKTPVENRTIQWCISSEALDLNNHAFGATWGGKNCSFHHNLFACNTGRNPSIGWGDHFDFRNNVLFNWRHRTIDGGDGSSTVNIVANYFKPGPAVRKGKVRYRICKPQHLERMGEANQPGKWYVAENFIVGNPKVTADNWAGGVQFDEVTSETQTKVLIEKVRANNPIPAVPITQQSAEEAYELVLTHAGATLPKRDAVDSRIIKSVHAGQPTFGTGIINTPADVGGWPDYKSLPAPMDNDHDGMPNEWEEEFGLNPDNASDGAKDTDGDGYTNVEEWLNGTNPIKFVYYRKPENNKDTLYKSLKKMRSHL